MTALTVFGELPRTVGAVIAVTGFGKGGGIIRFFHQAQGRISEADSKD